MGLPCTWRRVNSGAATMLRLLVMKEGIIKTGIIMPVSYTHLTGVEVRYNTKIGEEITIDQLRREYDAVYVSIGAQTDKKVGIEGAESKNVYAAVDLLGSCLLYTSRCV